MTKSKKQFAAEQQPQAQQNQQRQQQRNQQNQNQQHNQNQGQQQQRKPKATNEEFGRTVELAFVDHPWPASRGELLEHASRQGTFAKPELARLKQIPHRDYHSIADLVEATRQADSMMMAQAPGPVATAEHNRRAMGEMPENAPMHAGSQYDERTH